MRRILPFLATVCLSPLALAPLSFAQNSPYPANATFFTGDPPSLVKAATPDSEVNWLRCGNLHFPTTFLKTEVL
jgi:hypothetical protein